MPTLNQILDALLASFGDDVSEAFYLAMLDITSRVHMRSLIDHINNQNIQAAFDVLGINATTLRPVTKAVEDGYGRSGNTVGDGFPKWMNTPGGRVVFRFDERNLRSEQWLRQQSSRLVTGITDEQREIVRDRLESGMRRGDNPRTTALDLVGRKNLQTGLREGGLIGLTRGQTQTIGRVHDDLNNLDKRYFTRKLRDKRFDSVVRKAIESGKPLTTEQRARIAGHQKSRMLKFRADNIGRTESIEALGRADWEATKQVVEMGAAPAEDVERYWDSSGNDGITRASHLSMEDQKRGLDEPFETPSGEKLMYPADKSLGATPKETNSCRCRVRTRIDWLAQVK